MVTKQDLLDKINEGFDVVELISRGTTAGGKIHEYDLWYRKNSIVYYKRLHIYVSDDGSAEWYSENPIPDNTPAPEPFENKVRSKLKDVMKNNKNVKHVEVDTVDPSLGRATVTVFVDDSGVVKEKKAAVFLCDDGTLGFETLE